jgi:hypothetical protein
MKINFEDIYIFATFLVFCGMVVFGVNEGWWL